MAKRYWLVKSEPSDFSIDDLIASKDQTTLWDGIRNYQARNTMRDDMQEGDGVLFYHSRCQPPAIVGVAKVTGPPVPDPLQFDPSSKYHDPKSSPENPRWCAVPIRYEARFREPISLPRLRETEGLEEMPLLRKGQRLSVQPVGAAEWKIILGLEKRSR